MKHLGLGPCRRAALSLPGLSGRSACSPSLHLPTADCSDRAPAATEQLIFGDGIADGLLARLSAAGGGTLLLNQIQAVSRVKTLVWKLGGKVSDVSSGQCVGSNLLVFNASWAFFQPQTLRQPASWEHCPAAGARGPPAVPPEAPAAAGQPAGGSAVDHDRGAGAC